MFCWSKSNRVRVGIVAKDNDPEENFTNTMVDHNDKEIIQLLTVGFTQNSK